MTKLNTPTFLELVEEKGFIDDLEILVNSEIGLDDEFNEVEAHPVLKQKIKTKSKIGVREYLEVLNGNELHNYCSCGEGVCKEDVVSRCLGVPCLIDSSHYNIFYQGRECEACSQRVYKYKNFYITSYFDNNGDDCEVLDYDNHGKGGLVGFCEKYIKVYTVKEFNVFFFIPKSENVQEMTSIYKIFIKDGLNELKKHFNKQLEKQWNEELKK